MYFFFLQVFDAETGCASTSDPSIVFCTIFLYFVYCYHILDFQDWMFCLEIGIPDYNQDFFNFA